MVFVKDKIDLNSLIIRMVKIILTARETELADAWKRFCGDLECVSIYRGSILDVSCDAVVSLANSFGFMDGGIDLIYSRYFGWHVQKRLQNAIATKHHGELLLGSAEIVETDNPRISYVIAAPTMRVPTILKDSVNPYLAARAALLLIKHGIFSEGILAGEAIADAIQTVAFPGLGTGVGRVEPYTCAHQMRSAIEDVILEKSTFPQSWSDAQARHQRLYTDRIRNLQYEI
jgi:O-acetyl-ADP-ribose deacetylase (regulator of RNase III)